MAYGTTNYTNVTVDGTITAATMTATGYAFPKSITGTIAYTAFGTTSSTVGTAGLPGTIPAGATFYRAVLTNIGGFGGTPNASATLQFGDGTTANRYGGTINVYGTAVTSATGLDMGTPVAASVYHTAAKQPIATLTAGSIFGSITSGTVVAKLYYFD